jgi:hypothetical protein
MLVFVMDTVNIICAAGTKCWIITELNLYLNIRLLARIVCASERSCVRQFDHVFRWFPLVLEQILSCYPQFTSCSTLFMQSFQKWSELHYNANLQTQNSSQLLSFIPLLHTSIRTFLMQLPSSLSTAFPCF